MTRRYAMYFRMLGVFLLFQLVACDKGGDSSDPGSGDIGQSPADISAGDTVQPEDLGLQREDGGRSPEDSVAGPDDSVVAPEDAAGVDAIESEDLAAPDLPPGEEPTPVIKILEGTEVIPQTVLHFIGSQSSSPGSAITAYQWSVVQPPKSMSVFLPSATSPDPSFEVNTAGTYIFSLDVWDEAEQMSKEPATMTVKVVPNEAIHVELLWHNPADTDETDKGIGVGADLDLHFLHPMGVQPGGPDIDLDGEPDGWFNHPYDCFWFNPFPDWASPDPLADDDPGLDRDDTDGAGPENINLNVPEELTYRIGVHYWDDYGFGNAFVVVRVYIDGLLFWESEETELTKLDLWEVAEITWTGDPVAPADLSTSGAQIIPDYQTDLFLPE